MTEPCGRPPSPARCRLRYAHRLSLAPAAGRDRRLALRCCRLAAWGLALATLASGAAPASARSAGSPAPQPFGLTPSPGDHGPPRPYFNLTIAPGRSARDTAIISNGGTVTQRLRVVLSTGVTAANSGTAFVTPHGRCADAGCWVTGLPATVTLGPGASKALGFQVAVPAGTPPAQYLAGITAEPASRPRTIRIGATRRASAKVVIIDQVTVGIAVTVGALSRLRTTLVISAATGGSVGPTPRLYIHVRNPGQTFASARGTVWCQAGGRRSYRVVLGTVLPGDDAVLPVNTPGLGTGAIPCRVRLHHGTSTTAWSGIVDMAAAAPAPTIRVGEGAYATLPRDPVPRWAIALIVIGGLILAALVAVIVTQRRH